jgi:TRAP-type C4-dicarboxylate transport system permease small subunit
MERVLVSVSRFVGYLGAAALVVLMLAVASDVAVRFISGASLPGMIELAEASLVAAAFLGLAWTGLQGGHVDVDALTGRMKPWLLRIDRLVVWSLAAVTLAWMSYSTLVRAIDSTSRGEVRFGLLAWPLFPSRWIIVVGLVLWLLVAIANVVRIVGGRIPYGEDVDLALRDI